MQLPCVDSLRDREREITFLCKLHLWIEGKERKRSRKTSGFLPLNAKLECSVRRKGEKKPWLLSTLGRNDTSVWPSLAHQTLQTTKGRKRFLLLAEPAACEAVTGSHNGSWWLQHIPRRSGRTVCFFSPKKRPLIIKPDYYLTPKEKRQREWETAMITSGEKQAGQPT